MTNEEIYDKEIAPELLKLGQRCQDLNMSFVACVEYDAANQGIGRTEYQAPTKDVSVAQLITHWAARCKGNVDALFMAIDRHAKERGHSSVYLSLAGNTNVQYSGNETAAIVVTSEQP